MQSLFRAEDGHSMEFWYWIELIGFDKDSEDFGVGAFLNGVGGRADGVSLLLYNMDFVNAYGGIETERFLSPGECSYGGHPYNEDRKIQRWTNFKLKGLIAELQRRGIKVLLSIFNLYRYLGENGPAKGAFCASHPELAEFCSLKFKRTDGMNVLKRFPGGAYFEDYFIERAVRVLTDYGFDGWHVADGISSGRLRVQDGDYSDDMVGQFLTARPGISLPADIALACDGDRAAHIKRAKYFVENLRYEYTVFLSERFSAFFAKLNGACAAAGKFTVFNNAWARGPFEALFRYGVDYTGYAAENTYAVMFEDVATSMPLFSEAEQGGFRVPESRRVNCLDEVTIAQSGIKCLLPRMKQLNMTPIKDTQEQWNMIDNAPNEMRAGIARRDGAHIIADGKFIPVSNGAFYCLSDGLPADKWRFIHNAEDWAAGADYGEIYGFTTLFNENIRDELAFYIKTRNLTSDKIYREAANAGFAIGAVCRARDIKTVRGPVLCANPEFYDAETLAALEKFDAAPLLVFGYKNPLKRKCGKIVKCGSSEFICRIYNVADGASGESVAGKVKPTPLSPYDAHGGIWTHRLKYNEVSAGFFKACFNFIKTRAALPRVLNAANCKVVLRRTGGDAFTACVTNFSHHFELPRIQLPIHIQSASVRGKPEWLEVPFKDGVFSVRVGNRGAEIIDIKAD
ncbi:hypothetical protein FACS1894211_14140 [Clostridia bacterium]|nr:hypothetical protein FACS1894211_14140 [Clostridia bacterium]